MNRKKLVSKPEFEISADSDHRPRIAMEHTALLDRSQCLNPIDRILFQLVSECRFTQAQIALLLGVSESSISDHMHRLTDLLSRGYPKLLAHSKPRKSLDWKISRMACLHNRSIRAIARRTGLSLYQVRKMTTQLKIYRNQKKTQ